MRIAPFQLGKIGSRYEFGGLLNEMKLTGPGVEVGTHRGIFAKALLEIWKGGLFCVDPWSIPDGYEDQAELLPDRGEDRDADYQAACRLLRSEITNNRASLLRVTSAEAATRFSEGELDFVYIDGDHSFEAVQHDVWNWWGKLKDGGVLAGHDVVSPGENGRSWDANIQPVLLRFIEDHRRHAQGVYLVPEPDGQPYSWYIIKGGV